jgi:hypothetical protein
LELSSELKRNPRLPLGSCGGAYYPITAHVRIPASD